MPDYSIDVLYAWAQLGLPAGASLQQAEDILINAKSYRFATRERIGHIQRLTQFFTERARLGAAEDSFEAIRKSYYKQAMTLHPDRNEGDTVAEDKLKILNSAYELVEDIHAEAKDYFEKPEPVRAALDSEARDQAAREAEAARSRPRTVHMSYEEAEQRTKPQQQAPRTPPESRPPGAVKYMAASIPRFIRNTRLFYLGRDAIIGSHMVKPGNNPGLVYDVIMLTEREFSRARLRLSMEGYGVAELTVSKLTPPYIPIDVKEIIVPASEANPAAVAKAHFQREYGL